MNDNKNKILKNFLWGDFDYLHQRRIENNENLNKLIRTFNTLSSSTEEYIKALNLPKIKNSFESLDKHSLLYKSINLILTNFEIFLTQFNSSLKAIKSQFNELINLNLSKNEEKKEELSFYNELKKYKDDYFNSKVSLNKFKIKYNNTMSKAISSLSNDKNLQSISAKIKIYLDKYKSLIKETKNHRYSYIQTQQNTINFYENIEKNEGILIIEILKEYFSQQKILNEVIKNAIIESESTYNKFRIYNDFDIIINNFSKNKKDNFDEEINFIEYDFKKDFHIHRDENSYQYFIDGIQKLRINIDNNLFPSINLIKEQEKLKLGQNITNIITKDINNEIEYNINDLYKDIKYNDESTHIYFLEKLTILRGNGKFCQSKELIHIFGNIFNDILNHAQKNNNFDIARKCIMLSQTYYYMEKNDKQYLVFLIKKNKWLRSSDFWRNFILVSLNEEISNFISKNPLLEKDSNKKNKIVDIVFSCLIAHFNNLKTFILEKRVVKKIVNEFLFKFNLNEQYLTNINIILKGK